MNNIRKEMSESQIEQFHRDVQNNNKTGLITILISYCLPYHRIEELFDRHNLSVEMYILLRERIHYLDEKALRKLGKNEPLHPIVEYLASQKPTLDCLAAYAIYHRNKTLLDRSSTFDSIMIHNRIIESETPDLCYKFAIEHKLVKNDLSLFYMAIEKNLPQLVEAMLESGIDPMNDQCSGLVRAICRSLPEIVEILLRYGARPSGSKVNLLLKLGVDENIAIIKLLIPYIKNQKHILEAIYQALADYKIDIFLVLLDHIKDYTITINFDTINPLKWDSILDKLRTNKIKFVDLNNPQLMNPVVPVEPIEPIEPIEPRSLNYFIEQFNKPIRTGPTSFTFKQGWQDDKIVQFNMTMTMGRAVSENPQKVDAILYQLRALNRMIDDFRTQD